MTKAEFPRYSSADYLDNEEVIGAYLSAAMADLNPDVFLLAIANVAKARGVLNVPEDAGSA